LLLELDQVVISDRSGWLVASGAKVIFALLSACFAGSELPPAMPQ